MAEEVRTGSVQEDVAVYVTPKHRTLVGLAIFLAMATNLLISGSLSVVLPSLVEKVGHAEFYGLVFTINTVASVIFGPVAGRLGDLRDKGRLLIIGTVIVLVANLATALSPSMYIVLAARFVAGVGGVFITVLGLTVIGSIFPTAQRVRWMGFYGTLMAVCNAAGPILGGALTDTIGWEWVFYITIPLGVAGIVMLVAFLPKLPVMDLGNKFDVVGVVLFAVLMVSIIALCQMGGASFPWASLQTALFAVLIVVIFIVFALVERKKGDGAMMPMNMFQYPVYTVSLISVILLTAASIASYMYLANYMQNVMGASATASGVPATIAAVVSIVLSPILGQYIAKTGRIKSTVLVCCVLFAAPNLFYSMMGSSIPVVVIYVCQLFYGIGATIQQSIFNMAIQIGVPSEHLGVATAGIQTGMAIGSSVGMAVMTAVSNMGAPEVAIPRVFLVAAILSAVSIPIAFFLKSGKAAQA